MSTEQVDVLVIGAGIVGLATARALLNRHPGLRIVVVDKAATVAAHQSGHNSGVIHSGIYYRPGSAKARLCREGRARLLEFCEDQDIPYRLSGKLIVATSISELARLDRLHERARANGVGCSLIPREAINDYEPHATGLAALHVPETGVVDFKLVCAALARDVQTRGGRIELGAKVRRIAGSGVSSRRTVHSGRFVFTARIVLNCAGLHSDRIAALAAGTDSALDTRIVPFRGEYHTLVGGRDHLVRSLIYPVPDPRFPFLGAHFTRGIDGKVHVGPNAVLALGREAYRWQLPSRSDLADLVDPSVVRLGGRYWPDGVKELVRSLSRSAMTRALKRLVPDIAPSDLVPAGSGIRAQAVRRDGTLVDDFVFDESPGIVNVINAPSPAATACLAIAEVIAERAASMLRA
ncbi:MAG: L-2-hydroxyglutarate oxidase [Acidimicrobiales bacterium]|nr:L-2-hydroxyglutarate oxidase [Acidimicrobiales bacterium]